MTMLAIIGGVWALGLLFIFALCYAAGTADAADVLSDVLVPEVCASHEAA